MSKRFFQRLAFGGLALLLLSLAEVKQAKTMAEDEIEAKKSVRQNQAVAKDESAAIEYPLNNYKMGLTKFAVVGDYGGMHKESKIVAKLVKSWGPEFIITTGDNSFPSEDIETIDENVGPLYSAYIYPYKGKYEQATIPYNRFFPCLGDNDFYPENAGPMCDYFNFPTDRQYYDFVKGAVHFFALCSDEKCPNGITPESEQMLWLKRKAQESQSPWKMAYFHHPVYSSGISFVNDDNERIFSTKNSERKIDAPFSQWGISAVLTGHQHIYERFNIDGIPHIINGLGGGQLDELHEESPESLIRFSGEHGGMFVEASDKELSFKFITISGRIIDKFLLKK